MPTQQTQTPTPKNMAQAVAASRPALVRQARRMLRDESTAEDAAQDALVAAQGAVGFPVGHASAQQVWHGLRSRPTWRVLIYSAEEPPRRRALVLVDAVDGHVIQHLVQDNPAEDWDV